MADIVVLACGAAVQALAPRAGAAVNIPMLRKPARVALTSPLPAGTLKVMLCSKDVFIMQVRHLWQAATCIPLRACPWVISLTLLFF